MNLNLKEFYGFFILFIVVLLFKILQYGIEKNSKNLSLVSTRNGHSKVIETFSSAKKCKEKKEYYEKMTSDKLDCQFRSLKAD